MELSLAVNNSLLALMKLGIFCTEPFRIPLAGAIDVCCFDKTGTLTADEFHVKGIAGLDPTSPPPSSAAKADAYHGTVAAAAAAAATGKKRKEFALLAADKAPDMTKWVLAACHSLVPIVNDRGGDATLVGDPVEQSALDAVQYTFTKDLASARNGTKLRLVSRFPFSSELKRMSTIVLVERVPTPTPVPTNAAVSVASASTSDLDLSTPASSSSAAGPPTNANSQLRYVVLVKGAPEEIGTRLASVPPQYHASYLHYSGRGYRVLALAYKELPQIKSNGELRVRCVCHFFFLFLPCMYRFFQ